MAFPFALLRPAESFELQHDHRRRAWLRSRSPRDGFVRRLRDLLHRCAIDGSDTGFRTAEFQVKKDALKLVVIGLALAKVVLLAHWIDVHRQDMNARVSEERLYVDGQTAKRLTLAFNGLAA